MQLLLKYNDLKIFKVTRLLLICMLLVLVQVVQASATSYSQPTDIKENKSVLQQIGVTGKVTDSDGQPLPGVTILIKGTQWVATVPIRLYSERVRTYDAVTFFYVYNVSGSALRAGTDYTVSLENGTVLTPDANGAYSLTWPQTKKGIQNVKIKRSSTAPNGVLRVNLYDPAKGTPVLTDLNTTIVNKTADFEIRCMLNDNDRVTITFTD